jgi:hypothetical protein
VTPLCQRLSELDTGPIVGAIRSVARGELPDVESACEAAHELASVNFLAIDAVEKLQAGKLTRIEAVALLGDEPCPSTRRSIIPGGAL